MDCRFSFKQLAKSDVLTEFAKPKILAKIEKYSTKPIDVHVTFLKEGFNFTVRCTLKGGDGFNSQVESTSQDVYSALDLMLAKLEIQLKKQKEKIKRHKYSENENIRYLRLVPSEGSEEDDWDTIPVDAEDLIKFENARRTHKAS